MQFLLTGKIVLSWYAGANTELTPVDKNTYISIKNIKILSFPDKIIELR